MKLFDIKLNRYELFEDGLYIEYIPFNDEIKNYLLNGNTYELINDSIEETIAYYKPIVRTELYNLLPEDIKPQFINVQYKLTDSVVNPSDINYDIFGLIKKRTVISGELISVEYYSSYDEKTDIYSNLVVKESKTYNRDSINIILSRTTKIDWYLTDGTVGCSKELIKYYAPDEAIAEGVERRRTMISFAKNTLLSELRKIYSDTTSQQYAYDLLISLSTEIKYFEDGYTQPLIDGVNNSTKSYLTINLKRLIIADLTF